MPRSRIFFHFVWTTANRLPVLSGQTTRVFREAVRSKCEELGVRALALNGMPDHQHLIVSLPPSLAPATFIGHVKGITSRAINEVLQDDGLFRWQAEYAVMSLDERSLPTVVEYVRRQRERHEANRLIESLEPARQPRG